MTRTATLFYAAWISALLGGTTNAQLATFASGDDERVRIIVSVDQDTFAPGEVASIRAGSKVLVDGPLWFPQGYHQPLAFIYLRTPAGKVFVYPESGISPTKCRALEVADYRHPLLLKKDLGITVITYDIPLVDPSPEWLDARTFEPVRPNFRVEGIYEAWVKYTIPDIDGLPADAWNGTVETDRLSIAVRKIPVADRRSKATAEQIAHLEAYMKYMEELRLGEDTKPVRPEVVEMPQWMLLDNRLRWALGRTENEGLARHTVALLRAHQAKAENKPYPAWWSNVNFFVRGRASLDHSHGRPTLKILGPYLDEYALVAALEIERAMAGLSHGSSDPNANLDLLLSYLAYNPQSPIRQRLETLARRHARLPVGIQHGDREIRNRLAMSWRILFRLGILRDGMPLTAAKAMLGEPVGRKDDAVWWNYTTGSRRIERGVNGKIVGKGLQRNIVFATRERWQW